MRSKAFIGVAILVILVLMAGCASCGIRNALVEEDENVKRQWANVESVYQRRADLIPNLVRTVQRAEDFDRSTIEAVVAAQERAREVRITGLDPAKQDELESFHRAQSELGDTLDRLLARSADYDNLRSVEAFRELQDQIEGTANRINVARRDYNEAVQKYNSRVRRFPANVVAMIYGFGPRVPFEAEPGAERPPDLDG